MSFPLVAVVTVSLVLGVPIPARRPPNEQPDECLKVRVIHKTHKPGGYCKLTEEKYDLAGKKGRAVQKQGEKVTVLFRPAALS
jgi:hypothetical protein